MIHFLFILLLTAIVSLILIGYHRPDALRCSSFPFTRKCVGIVILAFAVAVVSLQSLPWLGDSTLAISTIAQGIGWIFLAFTFRGIFEVLSGR
ncbi:MAG: hypothetical protein ABIS50_07680 [Luteolibacter sp.]|uniref:hypothetical protein n=1 Tax=Luteolibacter sp. TaxID=1962973 RepID=UPI00326662B8